MLRVARPVCSAQVRISCEFPIQVTTCSTPAARNASMLTNESLPPPIATSARSGRPSAGASASGAEASNGNRIRPRRSSPLR